MLQVGQTGGQARSQAGGGAPRILADTANEIQERETKTEEKQTRVGVKAGSPREKTEGWFLMGRGLGGEGGAQESGKPLSKNCL